METTIAIAPSVPATTAAARTARTTTAGSACPGPPNDELHYGFLHCYLLEEGAQGGVSPRKAPEKAGIPLFIIANNKQLVRIIRQAPKRLEVLGNIDGIGKKKSSKYGEEISDILQAFYGQD